MKKNISINISGIIFHIEEDGYDTLRKYLDSVNKYFGAFEDSSEILADIEGRIAEIFLTKLNEGKQVITAEDVNFLMATMGSVNDFKAAEEQEVPVGDSPQPGQGHQKSGTYSSAGNATANKKLFRDQKRSILGGVCAGLGHYFNIDPVWPRLLFALLVLGSYGGLLLVYIIFWIVLPASTELEDEPTVKKMFRDTSEKKVLGGVASGVAAFFGVDTTIIRLLFVIGAIVGGLGFIIYIVLWIALPEAKTLTEKMQMQGEAVTLSNIESTVKKSLNEKGESEESTLAKIILFPFRALAAIINALAKAVGPLFKVTVDVLRIAIGIVILLTGLALVFALILVGGIVIGLFTVGSVPLWGDMHVNGLSLPLEAMRNAFPTWTILFAFLAAFIPALFILLIGGSIVSKRIAFNSLVGWTLFVIFFISVAVISFTIPQFVYSFKEDGEHKIEQTFNLAGKTPVFKISEVGLDDYDVTSLSLKGYNGKEIKLVERFEAQGETRKIAGENAKTVTYAVTQSDSILTFDSNIVFNQGAKFHAQRLDVDIFIPYNQPFIVDAELWRLIDTNVLRGHGSSYRSLNFDTQTWMMTERGCECVTCPKEETENENNEDTPAQGDIDAQDEYGLKDFNGIDLNGIFKATIRQGDSYSVRIKGNEATKKHYDVSLDGETLVIKYDDNRKFFWKGNLLNENDLRITIITPSLTELNVRGAGKVDIQGFDEQDMEIKFLGAVEGDGEFSARNLDIKLTGASSLELKGEGDYLEANITGASGLRAYGYEVQRAVVEAHGASTAKVNATETLEITKGVASSVTHRGNPEVTKRN
jgi:phage shock protein PspC (stress-responsive transcriptional regulator)